MSAKEAAIQAAQDVCGVKTAGGLGGMIGNLGKHWKAPAPLATPPAPPKPVPSPQPLQQPSTAGKMLGYKPTTTLGAQVGRWYENAGGLDKAINSAQQAQQNRAPGVLNANTWPKWLPQAVTERQIPVHAAPPTKQQEMIGQRGQWTPSRLYGPGQVWVDNTTPQQQSFLEHELSHAAFVGDAATGRKIRQSAGISSRANNAVANSSWQTKDLASAATKQIPNNIPDLDPKNEMQQQTYKYLLDPAEVDVRLAEIKRRYAHHTGNLVETPEQAQSAWEWWRNNRNQHEGTGAKTESQNTPTGGPMSFELYDKLPPAQKQQLFHRMPELVQNNPALQKFGAELAARFTPDYTPEQLENLGVYDALYRGKGPRLASLGEWKPEWVNPVDPKGWAQWYKRYSGGRRLGAEDERQIKRWLNFKSRHGGPFVKNPTPRRGWALRNWGIDPSKLVDKEQAQVVRDMLDEYQRKAMQKHVQAQINSSADLAAENPERQIGSNVKQAELVPEVQLQEHQQRIADRVTEDNPRLLVYHGLGSGKSLSALAAAEAAQKLYGGNYGVVVPASLRGNFQKEIKKFTRGSNPEVMSYTGLGMGKQFKDPPETLIMDEAARLRNPNSAMTQAAMRQARDAERLLLLTGTPITNAPTDLAPLVAMLDGKNIDPKAFGERYVGYKKVSPGFFGWLRGVKPGVRPYIKNEKELRQLLAGKVDYQPSKTPEGVNINEEIVRVPLSKEQQKIQRAIRTKIPPGFLWKLDREFPLSKDELSRLNGFLTGLRQVGLSTQPFRADKDPLKAFDQSAKLQKAFENLKSTLDSDPRKKALIYSNFVDAGLGPYAAGLQRANIPHAFFHGGVSPKARQAAVDAYNAGKLRALLIGPAGAEGISTKGTSLIQLMDPHWNEARTQQAQGRGLRFDSHRDLPEELKNVAVQRYLNQSEEPGWLSRKFMGKKRERTADEVLERLTAEKEQLNEAFRNLLREIGSQK